MEVSVLCCMREVFSHIISISLGACIFFMRVVSLGVIFCLVNSCNNLHALCILQSWMLCLSACKMMLVSVEFTVCESVGGFAFLLSTTIALHLIPKIQMVSTNHASAIRLQKESHHHHCVYNCIFET